MSLLIDKFLSQKIVVVTGHRGFIGQHLVRALKAKCKEVILPDGDVKNAKSWGHAFDVVYHLAAAMPGQFAKEPCRGFSVNVDGTLQVLEACRKQKAQMVFVSTCGVYSPGISGAVSEEDLLKPPSPYAQSKLMGEMLCRSYAEHLNVPSIVLRLFNVYGAGQQPPFLIPYLIQCALHKKQALVKHLHSERDFIDVSDVIQALLKAACATPSFGVYNIGWGKTYSVQQVLNLLGDLLERPIDWACDATVADPQPSIYADIECAKRELGWYPKITLDQGLRELIRAS